MKVTTVEKYVIENNGITSIYDNVESLGYNKIKNIVDIKPKELCLEIEYMYRILDINNANEKMVS